MTEWKRFNGPRKCGHCGASIPPGAAVRVIWGIDPSRRKWTLYRCEACSRLDGLYPPPDVPLPPRPRVMPSVTRDVLTPVGAIVRGWKDRVVGEDDD